MTTPKDLLIQELDSASDSLIVEVLDFLRFLKIRQEEDDADLRDARAALASIDAEGTVAWEDLQQDLGL